ncbi:hypothetical protein BD413DRAFT_614629 [Trametes elegans]|nr:hypothetical protein BD413DRAFT_614629 [Trametes elegans]
MPMLCSIFSAIHWHQISYNRLMRMFYYIVEGVKYLHKQCIAVLDICGGNMVVSGAAHASLTKGLVPCRVYIIDYDTARQLELDSGARPAISLPETQVSLPGGLKNFDPYSWDVYCLGLLLEHLLLGYCKGQLDPLWLAHWYARLLIGKEHGCMDIFHCRPTAQRAREVLSG